MPNIQIRLAGPGGAGKTTAGQLLAERLGVPFFDLDECFLEASGDIDEWIARRGYESYAFQNVDNYLKRSTRNDAVCALSSGFMTYPNTVHPKYVELRSAVSIHPQSFVLLPYRDKDLCVTEIVRRQMLRPTITASREREQEKIRDRFDSYLSLGMTIIESAQPPAQIADEIVDRLELAGELRSAQEFSVEGHRRVHGSKQH